MQKLKETIAVLAFTIMLVPTLGVQAQDETMTKRVAPRLSRPAGIVQSDKGILGHIVLRPRVAGSVRSDKGILGTLWLAPDSNVHSVHSDLGLKGWTIITSSPNNKARRTKD